MQNFEVNFELNWGNRTLPIKKTVTAKCTKEATEVAKNTLISELNIEDKELKALVCIKK